jgi:hypothetical protein
VAVAVAVPVQPIPVPLVVLGVFRVAAVAAAVLVRLLGPLAAMVAQVV